MRVIRIGTGQWVDSERQVSHGWLYFFTVRKVNLFSIWNLSLVLSLLRLAFVNHVVSAVQVNLFSIF